MRGTTKRRIKSKRNHLADLLSRKDVKEGFDRKPTTIESGGSAVDARYEKAHGDK